MLQRNFRAADVDTSLAGPDHSRVLLDQAHRHPGRPEPPNKDNPPEVVLGIDPLPALVPGDSPGSLTRHWTSWPDLIARLNQLT